MPDATTSVGRVPPRWLRFLQGAVRNPRYVASVFPSSRSLLRHLIKLPCVQTARVVVELGPGLGETTRALLERMPRDGQLMCIEIVPQFVEELRRIPDSRLCVVENSALRLRSLLELHHLRNPDVVVSGIPFAALSEHDARVLIQNVRAVLAPGGGFVAYQFKSRVRALAGDYFGSPRTTFVPWNVPPLRIYEWRKTSSTSSPSRSVLRNNADREGNLEQRDDTSHVWSKSPRTR